MDLGAKHVSLEDGFHFGTEEAPEDLGDGEAPIFDLEVCTCIIAHKDSNICLKFGAHERFRVRDVTLKNLRAKLQILPPGLCDKVLRRMQKKQK